MRTPLFLAIVQAFAAGAAMAQMPAPVGSVVKGFILQQRNDSGVLTANMKGETARVISVNRTEITELKIELMEGDKISTVITSPKSDFWHNDARLSTRSSVKIDRPDMAITAQTMDWEYKKQVGTLRQKVTVVLKNLNLSPEKEGTVENKEKHEAK